MADKCANCEENFVKKGKDYQRIKTENLLINQSIRQHFSELGVPLNDGKFICNNCYISLQTLIKLKERKSFEITVKRVRTPTQTPSVVKRARTTWRQTKKTWRQTAHTHFVRSKYLSLMLSLYQRKTGQRALTKFIKLQVRREIGAYSRNSNSLSAKVTQESLSSFSWEKVFHELQQKLPVLFSVLCAAATTKVNEADNINLFGSKSGRCVPIIGMASAVLFYGRQPRKYNFFQELSSLEMWKCGADQKLFQCFQRLGVCKGTAGAKGAVDRLRREFDREIVQEIQETENNQTMNETFESEQPMGHGSLDLWNLLPPNNVPKDHERNSDEDVTNSPTVELTQTQHGRNNNADSGTSVMGPIQTGQDKINTEPHAYSPPMDLSPT